MNIAIKTTPYDSAEYLDSDEAIAAYIDEALGSADPAHIAHALGIVARAKGMTEIARGAGVSREHLYRALKETGNPELSTVVRVLKALGLRLSAQPIAEEKSKRRRKPRRRRRDPREVLSDPILDYFPFIPHSHLLMFHFSKFRVCSQQLHGEQQGGAAGCHKDLTLSKIASALARAGCSRLSASSKPFAENPAAR